MIPTGNPISSSPIIAYGIRNSFGFAFDPQTGRLWDSQNGPACNDELNLVPRTTLTNFAWGPSQTCSTPPQPPLNTNQDGPNRVLPKFFWSTTVAPTGAAFCQACQLDSASNGKLFVGQYNTSRLRRFALNSTRTGFIGNAAVFMSYEYAGAVRHIYLKDPGPAQIDSWMGMSYGVWEGDTFVVHTSGFNDQSWFDRAGNHHSDKLKVTERYTMTDADHINYEATIDDPVTFTRPWKMSMPLYRRVEKNAQLGQSKCVEFVTELMYGHLRKEPIK